MLRNSVTYLLGKSSQSDLRHGLTKLSDRELRDIGLSFHDARHGLQNR